MSSALFSFTHKSRKHKSASSSVSVPKENKATPRTLFLHVVSSPLPGPKLCCFYICICNKEVAKNESGAISPRRHAFWCIKVRAVRPDGAIRFKPPLECQCTQIFRRPRFPSLLLHTASHTHSAPNMDLPDWNWGAAPGQWASVCSRGQHPAYLSALTSPWRGSFCLVRGQSECRAVAARSVAPGEWRAAPVRQLAHRSAPLVSLANPTDKGWRNFLFVSQCNDNHGSLWNFRLRIMMLMRFIIIPSRSASLPISSKFDATKSL